jgi:hypothetical protein
MMAADEEGMMKVLGAPLGDRRHHSFLAASSIPPGHAREFASPTQAVSCAVEIRTLKTRNDTLPEDRRMHFRIGVNLGDVMVKGDDLLGDGVNVAARLEGIAGPGHIYIASSVYDQIAGKLDLGFVDLGEQSLKNIDRPIRTYRVDRDSRRGTGAKRKSGTTPRGAAPGRCALAGVLCWGRQAASRQEESAKAKPRPRRSQGAPKQKNRGQRGLRGHRHRTQRALEEQRIAAAPARRPRLLARAETERGQGRGLGERGTPGG